MLDLGTGSGVLAIAAAKAQHRLVLASDIDPLSIRVARDNARLNGVGDLVQAIQASGFSAPPFAARGPFDVVLANALAYRQPHRRLVVTCADLRHTCSGFFQRREYAGVVVVDFDADPCPLTLGRSSRTTCASTSPPPDT